MSADQVVPDPAAEQRAEAGVQPDAPEAAERPAGPPRADMERKVVTALVARLAPTRVLGGDTEDHIAVHARVAQQVTEGVRRFGGTVHTLLGDTLLAVFGAELVREDDPERAVRAAMAVSELEDPAGLAVQVGVETGAAVVTASGDTEPHRSGMAGGSLAPGITGAALDVATALGLSAAPGSALVGPAAYRATVRRVEYEPYRAGSWRPLAPRSRIGSAVVTAEPATTPLVERDTELAVLQTTLRRVRSDREPQMVTLIGAPGIGKSRVLAEFGQLVDAEEELILWRQARSVPYGSGGEGVTLWALAEIVRAQAGIAEADPDEAVATKLHRTVADAVADPAERDRIEQRLRPLVQVASVPSSSEQRQLVQAWVRLLESVAGDRPLVVVVEDLQWADSALLDCMENLVDQVGWVPLLIVCTARPELLEHRPGWGGGKRNALTMGLNPLTESGSGALLDALLADLGADATLPRPTRAALLARAGGIPLYLEEYVRMLQDRAPGSFPDGELPLPETVQQIISARLDALPTADKALLQDMAVLGEVGRRDPLTALTGLPGEAVDDGLGRLARHDLIRPARPGRRGGPQEYVFRHALVRDVAYDLLLRSERADKHRRVAEWLSASRSGERAEEIAHHYQRALAYVRATGTPVEPLAKAARLAFRAAGDRAAALDALAAAIRYYDQALELWPRDDPDRADLLLRLGYRRMMASASGEPELQAARDLFEAAGESSRAAQASVRLGFLARLHGDHTASAAHNERALALVGSGGPPSRIAAEVLMNVCSEAMMADRNQQAIKSGREAVRMASRVGAADLEAIARGNVGMARLKSGDPIGARDLDNAIVGLEELGNQHGTFLLRFGATRSLWRYGDLPAAAETLAAARRGFGAHSADDSHVWAGMDVMEAVLDHAAGRWDEALGLLERGLERAAHHLSFRAWGLTLRSALRVARGDPEGAVDDARGALADLPSQPPPETLHPLLAAQACALLAAGKPDQAAEPLERLLGDVRTRPAEAMATPDLAVALVEAGHPANTLPLQLTPTRWHQAVRAFTERDFKRAAERYGEIGALPEQALARLYHARQLADAGKPKRAESVLQPAISFWEQVGATAHLRDAQALVDSGGD